MHIASIKEDTLYIEQSFIRHYVWLFPALISILMLDLFFVLVNNVSSSPGFSLKFCLPFLKLNKPPIILVLASSSILFFFFSVYRDKIF